MIQPNLPTLDASDRVEDGLLEGRARSVVGQAPSTDGQAQQLEAQALAKLESSDFQERMSGYASLERVGTQRALSRLETAFLERSGIEQDAAKRALDAVWQQIRGTPAGSTPFSRIFQVPQEN